MSGATAHTPMRLMLTGGGTGGHLFPAVATAEKLLSRDPESQVLFIGTRRRLDRQHLEKAGFPVKTIHSYGLKGKRPIELFKALACLPLSFIEACLHILRFRPHVVCGVGGYVTGPVVAAAWLLRRPTVIHEQNSVPGMANRKLGRLVDRVCLSLPDSARYFPAGKAVQTGNPIRRRILDLAASERKASDQVTLLVLGGSQGAHAINGLMVDYLTAGKGDPTRLRVIHQTGSADREMVEQAYRQARLNAEVAPFFNDMASIYSQADVVISRAGATTLAELSVLGLPAILIPYPFAADDHQRRNGAWYAEGGGALLLDQQGLTADALGEAIDGLINDRERRQRMSQAMKKLSIPDADDRIVDICLDLAGKK